MFIKKTTASAIAIAIAAGTMSASAATTNTTQCSVKDPLGSTTLTCTETTYAPADPGRAAACTGKDANNPSPPKTVECTQAPSPACVPANGSTNNNVFFSYASGGGICYWTDPNFDPKTGKPI